MFGPTDMRETIFPFLTVFVVRKMSAEFIERSCGRHTRKYVRMGHLHYPLYSPPFNYHLRDLELTVTT